ncbi:sugar phosphate exchanger 2-like [Tropilaelaps mercedesae]|uniref:Sugar phosphate exchanger 3 n=1 Tax=Tropilaelaps mercedesae TaxID=418985 RepID=A0A1V9WXZ8_9ACAR|nr:sugar phosphate exchanger 2-like [Tropilaelaps mercedesae]
MFPQPLGLRALRIVMPKQNPKTRLRRYRSFIFAATFLSYLCFHMTRRPIAVVKTVLNYNGSCYKASPLNNVTVTTQNAHTWCDWKPFGTHSEYLGYLDSVYLFSYAICMFAAGFVAERMHLRYFLSLGMVLSGLTTYVFGLGHTLDIHSIWFYVCVQLAAGGVQSAGWPAVVTVMSNWYGKTKKGLIFGIWNAHTSVGNIVGAVIASAFVETDWGYSFYVPGLICCAVGIFIFFFVPATPEDVGLHELVSCVGTDTLPSTSNNDSAEFLRTVPGNENRVNKRTSYDISDANEHTRLTSTEDEHTGSCRQKKAISFTKALTIPGVIEFSLALFFAKLVSYTFLFWLPLYVSSSTPFRAEQSAMLSTVFDVGGIGGGILAGYLSDRTGASATTSVSFLGLSIPALLIYQRYGAKNLNTNIALLVITGFLDLD